MQNQYYWALTDEFIAHHGIKGQKWGVKNGPPYPLDDATNRKVRMGRVHTKSEVGEDYRYDAKNSSEIRDQKEVESLSKLPKKTKNYSMQEEMDFVNPANEFGRKHEIGRVFNCQNSAVALDMRLKGYDVEARRKSDGSNVGDIASYYKDGKLTTVKTNVDLSNLEKLSEQYVNRDKLPFQFQKDSAFKKYHDEYNKVHEEAYDNFVNELKNQSVGSKGIVVVGWQNYYDMPKTKTEWFHAYNYEVKKDDVYFYDAQASHSSSIFTATEAKSNHYARGVDPREYSYMRTNDLQPSEKVTEAVVSRSSKK
jgi:hypothetical protein